MGEVVETPAGGGDSPPRVLVVEDDEALSVGISAALRLQGYQVLAIHDGNDFNERTSTFRPDLVLLDILLPGTLDGFDLGARMRTLTNSPIIFLTAVDSLEERLRGFQLGCDDYIVKPCAIAELLARIQVVLRRTGRLTSPTRQVRDLVVDEQARTVLRSGAFVELTPTEFELLRALVTTPGKVLSKTQLLTQVWGFDQFDPNLVEVYVSSLRRKLEIYGPRLIFTERGQGYVIRA